MKTQFRIVGVVVAFLVLVGGLILPTQASPPEAAPAPQGMQSMPGIQVVFRYDGRYTPYHVPPPEQAALGIQAATIHVTWNPASCTGTVTPWPSNAQTAFSYAVSIWASLLNSSQTIEVDACWRTDLGPGILGSAGPTNFYRNFPNAPLADTWYPVALANSLANSDLQTGPEISANFSSTFNWYYGTDGNTPPTQVDFASVVLHELGHGLGFVGSMLVDNGSGLIECNGTSGVGCWGFGSGSPFIYDAFAEDGNGTSLLATGTYPNPSTALGNALTGNVGGGVYFNGTNANAANGGARVKLYTPSIWDQGSSYSHLDEIFNGTPNALMTYSFSSGESEHSPGPVMLGMFQDMGWSVTGADIYEPDGTYTDASTITINGAAQHHTFHQNGDEDWAKFTVTAGETYTFTTSNLGTSADTLLGLYDTDGTSLLLSNDDCPGGGPESCINGVGASSAGTYFLRVLQVDGTGSATGYEYDLAVVSSSGGVKVYLPIVSKPSTTNWHITNNTGGTLTVQLSGVGTKQFGSGTSLWVVPSGSHDVYITTTGCAGAIDKTYDFPPGGDRYDIYTCS